MAKLKNAYIKNTAWKCKLEMGSIMYKCFLVGTGGFAGAVLRYLIGLVPVKETMLFPVKTFLINITGCILIGFITALVSNKLQLAPGLVLFLKTGVCGGFTTFSTFSLETSDLIKNGHVEIAVLYAVLSVVTGICAIFLIQYFTTR